MTPVRPPAIFGKKPANPHRPIGLPLDFENASTLMISTYLGFEEARFRRRCPAGCGTVFAAFHPTNDIGETKARRGPAGLAMAKAWIWLDGII